MILMPTIFAKQEDKHKIVGSKIVGIGKRLYDDKKVIIIQKNNGERCFIGGEDNTDLKLSTIITEKEQD